jgi:virginiamycin B lyase
MVKHLPLTTIALATLSVFAHAQTPLPNGPGKQAVETYCGGCHELARVTARGYTREHWQNTVGMMIKDGSKLPPDQVAVVVDYLAKNFPDRAKPPAQTIAGDTNVTIKEWVVPTPRSFPHDPLATPDGAIWYCGQLANLLGRLDPRTGQFKEYRITTNENAGPHGLVADKDGNIWFTENYIGAIGKLDPVSGKFSAYPLPDADARDPHTPVFDQKGTLWFTVQGANMVGRLQPSTGEIRLVHVPTPGASPYGMVITSAGIPLFAEFGTNKLASIDPETMAIHKYLLPDAAARPRRVAITPDDVYAIAYLKGAIWHAETGTSQNMLVRFDPPTEKFQTWPIPSGGGVVRNMMVTSDGNLALACSGVNRVALVEVK